MYYNTSHMRQVLSISLPEKEVKAMKTQAKQKGFKSFSAYVQFLISADNHVITEDELVKMVRQAEKEYVVGKVKKLHSLKDLV